MWCSPLIATLSIGPKETRKDTYLIGALLKETKEGKGEGVSAPENEGVFKPVPTAGIPGKRCLRTTSFNHVN